MICDRAKENLRRRGGMLGAVCVRCSQIRICVHATYESGYARRIEYIVDFLGENKPVPRSPKGDTRSGFWENLILVSIHIDMSIYLADLTKIAQN